MIDPFGNLVGVMYNPHYLESSPGRGGPPRIERTLPFMSIAITDDHRAVADTASDFLGKRDARGAARALLEAPDEGRPPFWDDLVGLGWLGLHVPEEHGGSGFGLEELVVVVEELGRAVAPGPFVPTVIASAVLAEVGGDAAAELLPGLADGSLAGAVALAGDVTVDGGTASGPAGSVLGGGMADVFLVAVGDDVAVVRAGQGVTVETPANLDPTRRSARISLDGAPATVLPGARRVLVDLARTVLAAEAVGVARECTEQAAAYAKERIQFGRPIAMFQAVKHHCANMAVATELATSAVWDAARAAATGGDQFTLRRRGGRHARRAGRRPVRQPQHPGPRRHRHHLGARRPPLHAPGHRAAALPRRRRRGRGGHRRSPAGAWSGPRRSSCRPRPRRSATRSGPSPTGSRACRPTSSATS